MKKRLSLVLVFVLISVLLSSCLPGNTMKPDANSITTDEPAETDASEESLETESESVPSSERKFDLLEYLNQPLWPSDDEKSLSELQISYSIDELNDFFGENNAFDHVNGLAEDGPSILQVDAKFPIELFRTGCYCVYRVQEGGYYFAFFTRELVPDAAVAAPGSGVYYTSFYLSSLADYDSFSSLVPGRSTARNVMDITNATEFVFYLNCATYSYSLLKDGSLVRIEYDVKHNDTSKNLSPDDLVVTDMRLFERNTAPCNLSDILMKDVDEINKVNNQGTQETVLRVGN